MYVADEGDGTTADAATRTIAGLEKWIRLSGTWHLAYVPQNGLNLGVSYGVVNYPTSLNPVTDGLRNITGRVNADGIVTVWGVTSTVSANGDQGADPNKLVTITDTLSFTSAAQATNEQFATLRTAVAGEVLRGVSFTPNSLIPLPVGNYFWAALQSPHSDVQRHTHRHQQSPQCRQRTAHRGSFWSRIGHHFEWADQP